MTRLPALEIRRRKTALETKLRGMRPIWTNNYHRELFQGNDGSYIIRGKSDGEVFYLAIKPNGEATNLLGALTGDNFYTILSCFQSAHMQRMNAAVSRWYANQAR